MVNMGALEADGDLLVFVNDDVEVVTQHWDETLLRFVAHDSVGVIGAHLMFPDGSTQHVGMTTQLVDGGLPIQSNYARRTARSGHSGVLCVTREVMAACGAFMAIRREAFLSVGGFSERFPSDHNDIDLCLKLRAFGLFTIVTPLITAVHRESQTRMQARELSAEIAIQSRWGRWTAHDPWRNPNVSHEDSCEKPDVRTWSRGAPFLEQRGAHHDASQMQSPSSDGRQCTSGIEVWPSIRERRVLQRRTQSAWPGFNCGKR
jgi:GT2 family glycosyltransferase